MAKTKKPTKQGQAGSLDAHQQAVIEIYNALMFEIEPDLTTEIMPLLDEMYAEESPEQKGERMARYVKAYETFSERFSELMAAMREKLLAQKQEELAAYEEKEQAADTQHISDIDRDINAT